MKKTLLVIFSMTIISCNGIHGWFPGFTDNPPTSTTQPSVGCNKDINVHYKNNCSKELIMYFIEVSPNTTINCETLEDLGIISLNETKTTMVHKGKLGYFVFAEDKEGKCTCGHRKAESYVNCEQSTGEDVYIDVCH